MKRILLIIVCCLFIAAGCGGGGGEEAEIQRVTEEFITAYQDGAVYTLQTLCAKDSAAAFDMTGEVHTQEVTEMIRASGQRSSFEILEVSQKGKTAAVKVFAAHPSAQWIESRLDQELPRMMVRANVQKMSDAEMDKFIIDTIIKILNSPRLEIDEGHYTIQLVKENKTWKVIPESPPFYLFEN